MDKLSEGISSAFNTAGTEANKAKLQTEIAMKQHQIKGIKQEFGVRRPVHEIKSDVATPRAVAAPRAQRVSEPPLLNHGLRGRHRRDVSTTAWSHRLISMIVHRSRRGTSWRATTPRASRRYSSKGRRPRRTSSATSAGSSGNSRTWAAPSRRTSCP